MPKRIVAGLLALILGLNALAMLFAGLWWYGAVPGVVATGPFNAHFVKDIGAAYLVVAAGLAWFAARPREGWGAMAAAAAFLTLHALVHLTDAFAGGHAGMEAMHAGGGLADLIRDFPGVFLPALLALWIAGRKPSEGA